MFEGANQNLIVYESLDLDQQKFDYIKNTKAILNKVSNKAIAMESKDGGKRVGRNIVTHDNDGSIST
jgi:hypothetical protein